MALNSAQESRAQKPSDLLHSCGNLSELESPILSHISLLGNEYGLEFQILDLDPLPEPISTPVLS